MYQRRLGPQALYRQQEARRTQDSCSLAEKFHGLKSLTVDLSHFNPHGVSRNSEVKYTVNLEHARSVFRFECLNFGCVGGDFDLSQELAEAVAAGQTTVEGQLCCQGWRNRASIDTERCHNILRYKLKLRY